MHILAISGSRNRQGKTALAMDTVVRGFTGAGGTSESIFLPEMALERCRQCNPDGWGRCAKDGKCINEDDLPKIVDKIKAADALVFASPVYFGDLSESMVGFLGRLRRVMRNGPPTPFPKPGGTPAMLMALAGGRGYGALTCLVNLEKMITPCGFDIVDIEALRRQNLSLKLPMLETVGKWLTTRPSSGPPPEPPAEKH